MTFCRVPLRIVPIISAIYLNSQPVSGGFFGGICLKIHTLPIDLDA